MTADDWKEYARLLRRLQDACGELESCAVSEAPIDWPVNKDGGVALTDAGACPDIAGDRSGLLDNRDTCPMCPL